MKATVNPNNRGTFKLLENGAPNLFRHRENQSYWGVEKMNGKARVMRSLQDFLKML